MPDYQKGKIYAIRSYQTDDVYIGSTCKKLSARMADHRSDYRRYGINKANYITSFRLLEYEDNYIELIENCPCDSKDELNRKEGYYIRNDENCVNKQIAGRTRKEYREDNKEKAVEYNKIYREENKEKIREHKKIFREENKEKIREHKLKPYTCECGKTFTYDNKARHERTKFHQDYITSLNEDDTKA